MRVYQTLLIKERYTWKHTYTHTHIHTHTHTYYPNIILGLRVLSKSFNLSMADE